MDPAAQGVGPERMEPQRAAAAAASGHIERLRFQDEYEVLLYLAGVYRDRIEGSAVWHSTMFDAQRMTVDLADEVVTLAADVTELKRLRAALQHGGAGARGSGDRRTLDAVWMRLVDRVAALARVDSALVRVSARMREDREQVRAREVGARIEDLAARTGGRELLTEQVRGAGEGVEAGGLGPGPGPAIAREPEFRRGLD